MFRLVVSICLSAALLAKAAYVDPASAKILKEQRFNSGDGRFGSAYAQEDGVIFREETGQDGERVGQYSYIDNDGKTITVKYSAGKDGFKILEGNHVPIGANGQHSAVHQAAEPRQQFAPAPVQQAAPAFQQAAQAQAQAFQPSPAVLSSPNFDEYDYDYDSDGNAFKVGPKSSRSQQVSNNPFINPDDPTHRNFQYNSNAANFDPNNPITKQLAAVPDCAGCAGVNPFINPFDSSHQAGALAGHQAGFRAAAPAPATRFQASRFADYDGSFAAPVQQAVPRAPVQQAAPAFRNNQFATQAPKRFFPPGKLDLNRYENGFSFDFSS